MKTLIFPGQGSQSVGMGQDLYKNFGLGKKIFKEADEKTKLPYFQNNIGRPRE